MGLALLSWYHPGSMSANEIMVPVLQPAKRHHVHMWQDTSRHPRAFKTGPRMSVFSKIPQFSNPMSLYNTHASQNSSFPPEASPPSPPIAALSFCNRAIYVFEVTFHASIYFSMHAFKHCCSPELNELPGDGTHFSKQFPLTLERSCLALATLACSAKAF